VHCDAAVDAVDAVDAFDHAVALFAEFRRKFRADSERR
jgi:hypothetical protein